MKVGVLMESCSNVSASCTLWLTLRGLHGSAGVEGERCTLAFLQSACRQPHVKQRHAWLLQGHYYLGLGLRETGELHESIQHLTRVSARLAPLLEASNLCDQYLHGAQVVASGAAALWGSMHDDLLTCMSWLRFDRNDRRTQRAAS